MIDRLSSAPYAPAIRLPLFSLLLAAALLFPGSCATGLQPVDVPNEFTPVPSHAAQWAELDAVREDDWFHLLNTGREALAWRLRAIDTAVESIDLQTFIWDLDGSGELIRQRLLAAADRGVFVRVLVDDYFILDADQALLDIEHHDGIELKVFNPYKRRSSSAGLRQFFNLGDFHRLDHHMHNRVMVIDNRVALVDEMSISAADNFAGIMQHTSRARVIGAPTPGQHLWGQGFEVTEEIVALIPVAEIIYPGGISLEGRGLMPDILVHQSQADLARGVDTQLEAALVAVTKKPS